MISTLKSSLKSASKTAKSHLKQHLNIFFKQVLTCNRKRSTSKKSTIEISSSNNNNEGLLKTSASFASMEISNQLEQVFKFIDANGDGKISPVELRELLLCLGGHDHHDKVEEEVEGMVKEMDVNGDGFIDLNEYMNVVMNMRVTEKGDNDIGAGELGGHDDGCDGNDNNNNNNGIEDEVIKDAFLVFDYDKNGLISAKELQNVMSRLGFTDCDMKECKLMINGVDKDGDGFVDFEEFRLMMMNFRN